MRKTFVVISITLLALTTILTYINWKFIFLLLILIPLIAMGLYDMYFAERTIRRNFPLLGRMRYLLTAIGPEMRQYFIETDTDGKPFNRLQRNIVYHRSKKEVDSMPFGTQLDVYKDGYEWINHSIRSIPFSEANFKVGLFTTLSANSSPRIMPIVLKPCNFPAAATAAM